MLLDILYIFLAFAFVGSILFFFVRRKRAGVTGLKTALPSICLFLLALLFMFAYWFDFHGVFTMMAGGVLLLLSMYFTRFLPNAE